MSRVLLLPLCLLSAIVSCAGQTSALSTKEAKPDLNGVWVFDTAKSNEFRGKDERTNYVLTIVQKEPEIKITARFKQGGRDITTENTYYTDGRRVSFRDPEVETRWRGHKLVMVSSFRAPVNKVIVPDSIVTTVEWILSADGNTLTRTTTTSGLVVRKTRSVFTRSS
jgi:hypothetical protein